jgi:phosphohistidine phosphatase
MAAKAAATRTLWLLRHAKTVADPPPGGRDFDRVLAPRGRRDATELGRRFADEGDGLGPELAAVPRPDVALVSPSARTMATAELVLGAMPEKPALRFDEELYGAEPFEVLALVQGLDDGAGSAMVVGHNPTAHNLALDLIAPRDKKGLALVQRRGFPTCALGVYTFKGHRWADVDFGAAKLTALLTPPYG